MRAVKGNKEYSIDEKMKKSYQDSGYDIYDDNGALIAYGRGKTVPYEEYEKLAEKLKAAEKENEELKEPPKKKNVEK
ncbi:MAG: hypothetical protein SOT28_01565 [Fusicatenibacter sp.]|nr:hypothetical protein [Lachnospiraceae bacterium]MDY2936995.1 hypothetical protein [Fusicatenibacter sp.]